MTGDEARYTVDEVDVLACRYEPRPWPFAIEREADIARHWAAAIRDRPLLFDGRVLMQTARALLRDDAGAAVFAASYSDVAFSAFLAWRDFGRPVQDPGRSFGNGFGMAALQGSDGGFVLGEMGAHTANAGRVYFPSGTPDLGDIVDGTTVDIAGSIRRELEEETGLDAAALTWDGRFTLVQDEHRTAFFHRARGLEPAAALACRIEAFLAAQTMPELERVHIVRDPADLSAAMPPFVRVYLRHAFSEIQPG